jgi:hypothetical protein
MKMRPIAVATPARNAANRLRSNGSASTHGRTGTAGRTRSTARRGAGGLHADDSAERDQVDGAGRGGEEIKSPGHQLGPVYGRRGRVGAWAAWVRRPPRDVLHRGLTPPLRGDRPPSIDMTQPQPNNPLHGVTLQMILERLVAQHGWEQLGRMIDIRCFKYDPSIKSSLQFLRRTPWARQQVEALYLRDMAKPSP